MRVAARPHLSHCEAPDTPLKGLEQHCHALGFILLSLECADPPFASDGWRQAGSWLELAAGIKTVEIITARFDESVAYCETVADFEDGRSKAVSDYHTELTRFLFSWGAFETIVEEVRPTGWRRGKVRAAAQSISGMGPDTLSHYSCVLKGLKRMMPLLNELGVKSSDFEISDVYGASAIGIRVVYKLRNALGHGSLDFPLDERQGRPRVFLARAATRTVLLTIQMLLIQHFIGRGLLVDNVAAGELEAELIEIALRRLHIGDQDTSATEPSTV